FYQRWAAERPRSITAQVCLIQALTSYAWRARGSGWADSVTEEGWRLFGERLDQAADVASRAKELPEKCPGLVHAAQKVALGQGWDRAEYFDMVDPAIAAEPTFGSYYTSACYYLFPRWYGEPGDFEKWIAAQAAAYPPAERDRQYARLVWLADRNSMPEEMVFAPGRLDWERARRGFAEWLQAEPDSLIVRMEFTRLAVLADDRETARAQFDLTGGQYFWGVWRKESRFEGARQFAYAEGPNPFREESDEPPVHFDEKTRQWVQLGLRLINGFCGGFLAGGLLLLLAIQRKRPWAGVGAGLLSLLLGTAFGTLATTLAGAALWFYLRRQRLEHPPSVGGPPAWLTLLWTVLLALVYLGLQIAATIPAVIPLFLESGEMNETGLLRQLMLSGAPFHIFLSASWITFLLLLAVCGPRNAAGWRDRLGLHRCALLPSMGWTLAAGALLIGGGLLLEPYLDARTREAMELLKFGMNTPWLLFASIVLVAPVVEELIFRGYAYSGWMAKLGFWGAALLSSLLFMACHLQYGWSGLLEIFFLGILLAAVRWKTGSVYPCIALHVLNNLAGYLHFLPEAGS
ncbi:MAG TPA: type II CAAX endopeptidase family protein, partial [Chthoniobacterales bacterium]